MEEDKELSKRLAALKSAQVHLEVSPAAHAVSHPRLQCLLRADVVVGGRDDSGRTTPASAKVRRGNAYGASEPGEQGDYVQAQDAGRQR